MALKCIMDGPEYGHPCSNPITHMMYGGYFGCDEHGHKSRAVVLYLPINGQVLMMKRSFKLSRGFRDDNGYHVEEEGVFDDYCFPGGKVEPGETDWEAIVRETFEETGLDITDPTPLFVRTSAADTGRSVTVFTARLVSEPLQDLKQAGREGEPVWGPPEWLVEPQCTYRIYNEDFLAKIGAM